MENMIEIKDLYFSYSTSCYSLYNLNLSVKKGEKVLILGARDSGKNSLLKLIVGLNKVSKGTVLLNGKMPTEVDFKKDVNAVYINEQGMFRENKTVIDNLKYLLKIRGELKDTSEIILFATLKNFGLFSYKDVKAKKLNLYNRILLSFARASLREKIDLMLIGDVFYTLNSNEQNKILDIIKTYLADKELTMVICTSEEIFKKNKLTRYTLNLGILE